MRNSIRRLNAIEHSLKHSAGADEGLRRRELNLRVMADPEALEASLELFGWVVDHETNPRAPWEVSLRETLALPEAQPMLERLMPALRRAGV